MRTLWLFLIIFPLAGFGQNAGTLKVKVQGDTVILCQDTALRNCGALYQMKTWLAGDVLYWYQTDTGVTFGCLCFFNLSVSVDSLNPGNYTARAYYTQYPDWGPPFPDTVYAGSVGFTVTKPGNYAIPGWVGQEQSDCFELNPLEVAEMSREGVSVYPNPAAEFLSVTLLNDEATEAEIMDMRGKRLIFAKPCSRDFCWDVSPLQSGLYILKVITSGQAVFFRSVLIAR